MMLRFSFNWYREAQLIEIAVREILENDYRTRDIWKKGAILLSTEQIGSKICESINK